MHEAERAELQERRGRTSGEGLAGPFTASDTALAPWVGLCCVSLNKSTVGRAWPPLPSGEVIKQHQNTHCRVGGLSQMQD